MHLLFCCATPWELKAVKQQIKQLQLKQKLSLHYLCTGVGNYATILSLTKFLTEQQDSDFFLINLGVCGYRSPANIVKTPFQIARIKNLHTGKELLPPLPFQFAPVASVRSSETPLLEPLGSEGFVEMEARGVETVADAFRLPRLLLKVPFDRVGEETRAFDKEAACKLLAEAIDYRALLIQLSAREQSL